MKAARLHAHTPATFVHEDAPNPTPADGEVLSRVHAGAVTPTELVWFPTSKTPTGEPRPLPLVMGHEFSGVIAGLGSSVTGFTVGDAVFGMNDWFRDGLRSFVDAVLPLRAKGVAR